MTTGKPSLDPREYVLQRARERLDGSFSGGTNHVHLPEGVRFRTAQEGPNVFDFVPYTVEDRVHPDRIPSGMIWFRRPFWLHRNIGPGKDRVLCLRSVSKECPVCEDRQRLIQDGADRKLTDPLKPSYRELYLLINDKDEYEVIELPYACFGKALDRKLDRLQDDRALFFMLKGGFTVTAYFVNETGPGNNTFLKVDEIEFDKREELDPSFLEEAPCLDSLLRPLEYDALKALYLDLDDHDAVGAEPVAPGDVSEPPPEFERGPRMRGRHGATQASGQTEDQIPGVEVPSRRSRTTAAQPPARTTTRTREEAGAVRGIRTQTTRSDDDCVACSGTGKSTRGGTCVPCGGTGKKAGRPAPHAQEEQGNCPAGLVFGQDTDTADECAKCEVWQLCADAKEEGGAGAPAPAAHPQSDGPRRRRTVGAPAEQAPDPDSQRSPIRRRRTN